MERKPYTTPNLIVHGALEDITKMPPKEPAGGDGKSEQPFGKVAGSADAMNQDSRS